MNFFERTISFFSPSLALKRAKNFAAVETLRSYTGASRGKRLKNWSASSGSINRENLNELKTLRDRSRDLVRNNSYAAKGITVLTTNVVGSGIRPKITGGKTEQKRLEKAWKYWANKTKCDFDGNLSFYGLQALIARSVFESGDCIIRLRNTKDAIVPIELQVVEGDLLDHNKTQTLTNGSYVIQGVEFDSNHKKVAYWMFDHHPEDTSFSINSTNMSRRIPAENIIHVFETVRPGQVRGVPRLAPAMLRLRDFEDYEDAQLVRQKIAACFTVFVQDSTENIAGNITGVNVEDGELSEKVTPGTIEHLPAGKTVTFANPPGTEGYGEYAKNILRGIAAGLGITYESLTGDLSNVNFSSGRMGWIEAHRLFSHLQETVMVVACDKIFNWFLKATSISGQHNDSGNVEVTWTTPRREMIDPVKEIQALGEEVRNGFTSWSDAVSSRGWDPTELLDALVQDMELFDKFKIILASDYSKDPAYLTATKEVAPTTKENKQPTNNK